MAKNKKSIFDQLQGEVTPEIEEKLERRAALQEQAAQKRKSVERVREQKKDLENKLAHFKDEAGKAMMNGEDPLPWLDKVSVAKEQIQSLEDFLPSTNSDPAAAEQKQLENLHHDLAREVKSIINRSEAKAQAKADFEAALGKVKAVVDSWLAGVDEFSNYYGLPKGDLLDQMVSQKQFIESKNNLHRWARDYFS
jgi:chromosome segregation ATPase